MNPPLLVGLDNTQAGKSYPITEQGLQIGREPGNDICLQDPDVSRHHARVILYNSALWVQDTGSRNGVYVNNNRINNHKQLSPGDRLLVGSHSFQIELPRVDEPSVQVDMNLVSAASAGKEKGGFKKWPFVVVLVLLGGLIGGVTLMGGKGSTPASADTTAAGGAPAAGGGDYSLQAALGNLEPVDGDDAAPGAPTPATTSAGSYSGGGNTSLADALRTITDGEAAGMEGWPDPPEDTTWQELVDQGHSLYRAGRLHDALTKYQMGAKAAFNANEQCEICMVRIEKVSKQIDLEIQENYDAGFKYFESMQYQQAIAAWETVLLLEPDEEAEIHVRTAEYLEKARAALTGQY